MRSGKKWYVQILLWGVILWSGTALGAGAEDYVKKDSWAETLLATRAKLLAESGNAASTEFGVWSATEPLACSEFGELHFKDAKVDLNAVGPDGQKIWKQSPQFLDGTAHGLQSGKSKAATYLFRTIQAKDAMQLPVAVGSDDGIEVWLNGKKIHSNNVPRGVGGGRDKLTLDLQKGGNELLMKIYNISGGHGFYFASSSERQYDAIGASLQRDFPQMSVWVSQDVPQDQQAVYFQAGRNAEFEINLINKALQSLQGAGAEAFVTRLKALQDAKTTPADPGWLTLYTDVCQVREGIKNMAHLNLPALRRAIEDLRATQGAAYKNGDAYLQRLEAFEKKLPAIQEGVSKGEQFAYAEVNAMIALQREALLSNPVLDFDEMLVIRRSEFSPALGLPQNWQGNCSLERSNFDNEIMKLSDFRSEQPQLKPFYKPEKQVCVADVDLNFDADKLLFSMIGSHNRWQIWEIGIDGQNLRQVTPGTYPDYDNYDACYLPSGKIMFGSTAAFHGVPCVGGADTVANMCVMDADGQNIRQLTFDQDHNWCPTVMNDGRVLYTRWEYSDTSHYFTRLIFTMNPDGTSQFCYYGSNGYWPNSKFYTRPIPGDDNKVVTVASGHHGVPRMGELVILDTAKGRTSADGAVQRIPGFGKKVEPIIMDTLVDAVWPKFLHPFPLNDKYFLVACKPTPTSLWGIYLVDVFDNMTLIKEVPGNVLFEPVPLKKTTRPPVIPDRVDPKKQDAVVYLTDVYSGPGLRGVPKGTVKKLRLYEFHYSYPQMGGHVNVGVEGAWDVHRILGTVPVQEDGSAMFRVPANTPIAIQPLDSEGKAIQIMRSWFAAMPGETLSCIGCHESQNQTPMPRQTLASRQGATAIEPWYGPARGFSFKREVQPVLDKYCVGCHDGKDRAGEKIPDFSRKEKDTVGVDGNHFTSAYLALHPYVRRPGPESDYSLCEPMEFYAGTSELIQLLKKGHHGVELDGEAWDRLYTWIDLNVPDHGNWSEQRPIPANFHERRMEMRKLLANRPEDPEILPPVPAAPAFVSPKRPAAPAAFEGKLTQWPFNAEEAKKLQAAAGAQTQRTLDLGNGVKMDFVLIPAGEFVMGDAAGTPDENARTSVKIEKPFWLSVNEVTLSQYQRFDEQHKSQILDQQHKDHTTPGYPMNDPNHPAIRISWKNAVAFCEWLGKASGEKCVLPTEAQWEWACRAGTDTPLNYGDVNADFSKVANLADKSMERLCVRGINPQPIDNPTLFEAFLPMDRRFNDGERLMTTVGKYQPNAWGLHDMHGNVAEWTRSLYRPYPYRDGDGRNALEGDGNRVVRGGSWYDRPYRATSAFRLNYQPWQKAPDVGFRVAIESEGEVRTAQASGAK